MIAVGLESTFCLFIFRAAVLVPPHPGGWQENCVHSQFTWSLGFQRGGERRFPIYSMGFLFKAPCAILSKPVVSLWETETIGFMTCLEVPSLAKLREPSLVQEWEGAFACTALCLSQMQMTLCHLWAWLLRRNQTREEGLQNESTAQPKAVSQAWCCSQEQVYTWQQTLGISFLRGLQKPSLHFSLSVEQHQASRIDLCCQSLAGVDKQMALSGEQAGPG